jgi:hypothetical protein
MASMKRFSISSELMDSIQNVNPIASFDEGITTTAAVLTRAFDSIPTRIPEFANATPESLYSGFQNKLKTAAADGYGYIDEAAGRLLPVEILPTAAARAQHAINVNMFNVDDAGALSVTSQLASIEKNNFSF